MAGRRSRTPPTQRVRAPLRVALWTCVPCLLWPAALKWAALAVDVAPHGLRDTLVVMLADIAFGVACVAIASVLAGVAARARVPAMGTSIVLTAGALGVSLLSAVAYWGWSLSGSQLDFELLVWAAGDPAYVGAIAGSEVEIGAVALLCGAVLVGLVPPIIGSLTSDRLHRRLHGWQRSPLLLLPALLSVPVASLGPSTHDPDIAPLRLSPTQSVMLSGLLWLGEAPRRRAKASVTRPDELLARATTSWRREKSPTTTDARPMNILMIALESTGARWTTPYDPDLEPTPHLARLARNAAIVERAYVQVPHTYKALVSVWCGYTPASAFEPLETRAGGLTTPCLPHHLRRLGYRTRWLMASDGGFENGYQLAENAGFESFVALEHLDTAGFARTNYLGFEDRILIAPALDWMEADEDTPFFLSIVTLSSHHGYGTPAGWPTGRFATAARNALHGEYLDSLSYTDAAVGELIDAMAARGLLEQTLVVVVGDHGEAFREHGMIYHNDVIWDEVLHVPMLLSNPRLFPRTQRVEGLRSQMDLAPTILSLIGAKYPPGTFEGRDLLRKSGHDTLYASCWYERRCATELRGHTKTITHFDRRPDEVYDLRADPGETRNLLVDAPSIERQRWLDHAEAANTRIKSWLASTRRPGGRLAPTPVAPRCQDGAPRVQIRTPALLGPSADPIIEVAGFDPVDARAEPGRAWRGTLWWRCLRSPVDTEPTARMLLRLNGLDGRVAEGGRALARGMPDGLCADRRWLADPLTLWVPADFPAGRARLWWAVEGADGKRWSARAAALSEPVQIDGDRVLLSQVDVPPDYSEPLRSRHRRAVTRRSVAPEAGLGLVLGETLHVDTLQLGPSRLRRHTNATIRLTLRVLRKVRGGWRLCVWLTDSRHKQRRNCWTPVAGTLPLDGLRRGDQLSDEHAIFFDGWWPPGPVRVHFAAIDREGPIAVSLPGRASLTGSGRVDLGEIQLE